MRAGFCYIAEYSEPDIAARRIISRFGEAGVTLTNPNTSRITEIVDQGEQSAISEAGLLEAVRTRPYVSFQMWNASGGDVTCDFRRLAAHFVRQIHLVDGLDANERRQLMNWALGYFREIAAAGFASLLVIDPVGLTENIDWDAVAAESEPFPKMLPAIIGLHRSRVGDLGDLAGYHREPIGDFELLRLRSIDELHPGAI